jgi:hypothetical protein
MDTDSINLNSYLEVIKKNINNSLPEDLPFVVYTIIPDLKDNYYVNIAKTIQSKLCYYNCLFMITDILFGTGITQLVEKLIAIKVNIVIIIDVNHELKEQLKENKIKTITIN